MTSIIPAKYSKKIKKIKKLQQIVGKFPRKRKVILCHGNFDVVHPGHEAFNIRKKNKADILAVSITADKYVGKGMYRPFVPQNLRALNLAAFEMVDYVIIDHNKKPLKNLSTLNQIILLKDLSILQEIYLCNYRRS